MKCQFCQQQQRNFCCMWYQYFYITNSTDWGSADYKRFLKNMGVISVI